MSADGIYDKKQMTPESIAALKAQSRAEDVSSLIADQQVTSQPTEQIEANESEVQWSGFLQDIDKFDKMYKLPQPGAPTTQYQRVKDFIDIIREEVSEGEDILKKLILVDETGRAANEAEILTDMADWLGDMVVYCVSEMRRYGLKPDTVLGIIMESNFSKLDGDGEPIFDDRGKVGKGPGFWSPEIKLREWIESKMNEGKKQ